MHDLLNQVLVLRTGCPVGDKYCLLSVRDTVCFRHEFPSLTQNSAAAALGNGSWLSKTLSVKEKMSRILP